MSEQNGIIRKPQTGSPDNPKFNSWWRRTLPHSESLEASSLKSSPGTPAGESRDDGERSGEPGGGQGEEDLLELNYRRSAATRPHQQYE